MIVRVGIANSFRRFSAVARELGAPILVSANGLRLVTKKPGFLLPSVDYLNGCDAALDSAGFVAMMRYGGYPWSLGEYLELAAAYPWAWWAARDFCCEPEIARNRGVVLERIERTVIELRACNGGADEHGLARPMPVLQGWEPDDYERCADMIGELPALVGVGSVCRRHLGGPDGLLAVVDRLDRRLPAGVGLHLFGVKADALPELRGVRRVRSVDSAAWDFAARRRRRELGVESATVEYRAGHLRRWYGAQRAALSPAQGRLL